MSVGELKRESEILYEMLLDDQRKEFKEQKLRLIIKDDGYKRGIDRFSHFYRELIHRWSLELELEQIRMDLDKSHIRQHPWLYDNTWQRGDILEDM